MALRLLIVDDNVHFLRASRDLLEREGCEVVAVASTATEAVERVADTRPDVALIDVDLGEESGFEVARQVVDTSDAPVILISAYPAEDLVDLVDKSAAIGFLSKPRLSASAIREVLQGDGAA